MNIRKIIDYSEMYTALDTAMAAELSQVELYSAIGKTVSARSEKGAAVAAAEYLRSHYPDVSGFSPRNLRRMRDFYRTYQNNPSLLSLAMQIGWTQNVVIFEADLTTELREWYLKATKQFDWSKAELTEKVVANAHEEIVLAIEDNIVEKEMSACDVYAAHTEIVLDNGTEECIIEISDCEAEITIPMKVVKHFSIKLLRMIQQRCRGKPTIGLQDSFFAYYQQSWQNSVLSCEVWEGMVLY